MKKSAKTILASTVIALAICMYAAQSRADCRAVSDGNGLSWVRVKIINNAYEPTHWAIWNCRAAVSSTDTSAVTEFAGNWDGVVDANSTAYVWIYGDALEDLSVANTDGSEFRETHTPVDGGDGEWVIEVSADGLITGATHAGASYGAPSVSGS